MYTDWRSSASPMSSRTRRCSSASCSARSRRSRAVSSPAGFVDHVAALILAFAISVSVLCGRWAQGGRREAAHGDRRAARHPASPLCRGLRRSSSAASLPSDSSCFAGSRVPPPVPAPNTLCDDPEVVDPVRRRTRYRRTARARARSDGLHTGDRSDCADTAKGSDDAWLTAKRSASSSSTTSPTRERTSRS